VSDARYCPSCAVEYQPLQEYCLECGTRLPTNRGVVGVLASAWQRRLPWYPGDWIWPTLLLLVVAAIAAAAAVAARSSGRTAATIVATNDAVAFGPAAAPPAAVSIPHATLGTAPKPTIASGPLPTAPAPASTTAPTTTTQPLPAGLITWPAKRTGYTDVLESLPIGAGRPAAVRLARAAKTAGLPSPGILVSARYASLHPGYFIVFSGIYDSADAATAALAQARAHGFPDAYAARVTH
jgi:hypothetical protein